MQTQCPAVRTTPIHVHVRGLFDKFVEMFYKIVSDHSILIVVAQVAVQYVYDRYCKLQFNMCTRKKVTHILLTYGNKHCRAPN